MSADRCPDCGASIVGGRAGCQALLDEISARAYSDLNYAATHDLAFDTYCMQHPERYCRSAKSYAAHLTRLCCGLEHRGDPKIYGNYSAPSVYPQITQIFAEENLWQSAKSADFSGFL